MSQHPRSVPSGSGLAVREGFNNALDSAFTLNSGPTAPASPQAGLLWLDTATGVLKIRNDANTAWVDLADRLAALRHDAAQTLTSGQKQQAKDNIGIGKFKEISDQTHIFTPNDSYRLTAANGGAWGMWDVPGDTWRPLGVESGGTGANTPTGARNSILASKAAVGSVIYFETGPGVALTNTSESNAYVCGMIKTAAAAFARLFVRASGAAGWSEIGSMHTATHAAAFGMVPPGWQYKFEGAAMFEVKGIF